MIFEAVEFFYIHFSGFIQMSAITKYDRCVKYANIIPNDVVDGLQFSFMPKKWMQNV